MKIVEELKNKIINEAIEYYLSHERISIRECAKMFDMTFETLSSHLKKHKQKTIIIDIIAMM